MEPEHLSSRVLFAADWLGRRRTFVFGCLGTAAFAPAIIGLLAAQVSIAMGMLVMGVAYLLTALIPALFIRDKIYDPQKA